MKNMKNIIENWKPIKNYEGLYEVSDLGNIRSVTRKIIDKNNKIKIIKGRIHKLYATKSGYIAVSLYKNSKQKVYRVHRLVAEAFIPNPNNLPQVNHIDENKENNCINNLEWCTVSENALHKTRKGERKILQYDRDGNFIKEWKSIKIASIELNISYSTLQDAVKNNRYCFNSFWRYYSENYPDKIEVKISIYCGRPVYQYDLEGNFIKKWNSITEVSNYFNVYPSLISRCLKGTTKSYKKYLWRYYSDNFPLKIEGYSKNSKYRKVNQYNLKGEFIKTWDSMIQIEETLNIKIHGINDCCKGILKSSGNYIWKFYC